MLLAGESCESSCSQALGQLLWGPGGRGRVKPPQEHLLGRTKMDPQDTGFQPGCWGPGAHTAGVPALCSGRWP